MRYICFVQTTIATAVVDLQWCRSAVQYYTSHTAFHRILMFNSEVQKTKEVWKCNFSKCFKNSFKIFWLIWNSLLICFFCDKYKKSENFLLYQILFAAFIDVTLVYDNDRMNLDREILSAY